MIALDVRNLDLSHCAHEPGDVRQAGEGDEFMLRWMIAVVCPGLVVCPGNQTAEGVLEYELGCSRPMTVQAPLAYWREWEEGRMSNTR